MIIKLLLPLLLITVSCGPREVKFPNGAEAISPYSVTNAEKIQTDKEGLFTKHQTLNGTTITTGGKSYPFSEYSSHQALTFYANAQMGAQVAIKFRGELVNGKLVLEIIELK